MNILFALLVLNLAIFVHELGHFLIAKKNGIKVLEFSLGMGPRLLSFKRNETRYSIKLLPIGGSCIMQGEDTAVNTNQEGSFAKKSVSARFSTIFAGAFFNFLYAFLLSLIFISSYGYDVPVISSLSENGPAYKAGLKKGDRITEYNGYKIRFYRDMAYIDYLNPILLTSSINISVDREGEKLEFSLYPEKVTRYLIGFDYADDGEHIKVTAIRKNSPLEKAGVQVGDIILSINGQNVSSVGDLTGYFGKNPLDYNEISLTYSHKGKVKTIVVKPEKMDLNNYGFAYGAKLNEAKGLSIIKYSIYEISYWIKTGLKSLGYLVTGKIGLNQLSGPVGLVNNIGQSIDETSSLGAKAILSTLLTWSIILSSNLGVMNLLPLPALDGGRLVFIIIEAIRGKAINKDKESLIHYIGFIMLMILMAFVLLNDLKLLFSK